MIKVIVYHNEELIKTYEFKKSSITLGRLPQNDVPINSTAISRMHLKIAYNWDKEAYFATDLNSLNGTFLNGEKISETQIESDAKLVSSEFVIVPEFVGTPEPNDANGELDPAAQPELMNSAEESNIFSTVAANRDGIFFSQVVSEKNRVEEIAVKAVLIDVNNKIIYKINKRVMSFGSAATDDFYIESGVFASENTTTLTASNDEYSLQSNTMMGRFKLNGNKVSKCVLQNNDRIELGSCVFTFKLKSD
ncbi:MAG: FHA domain-containing protein [Chitinivibrionia bacterium]|nr:FHA domain-containing protein [Chitinivibrionia bacterium]